MYQTEISTIGLARLKRTGLLPFCSVPNGGLFYARNHSQPTSVCISLDHLSTRCPRWGISHLGTGFMEIRYFSSRHGCRHPGVFQGERYLVVEQKTALIKYSCTAACGRTTKISSIVVPTGFLTSIGKFLAN